MRRIGAILAAAMLTLSLGSAAAGASSTQLLLGDFDALWMNGSVAGHITIRTSGLDEGPGTWAFDAAEGGGASGVIGEAAFYTGDGFNEVWFKALEVAYPNPSYGIFIAHVVDVLDPAGTDTIEFWSAPIDWSFTEYPAKGGSIGSAWNGTMEIGPGAFVLKVRVSDS